MPQESADILGYLVFLNIEVDQAVVFVAQAAGEEIAVEREERWPVQLMQQTDYFTVLHTLSPDVLADLPEGDTPTPQLGSLTFGDVLVQDVHAGRDSRA